MPIALAIAFVGEVVDGSVIVTDKIGESPLGGTPFLLPMTQMPFAEYPAMLIASLGENICHSFFGQVQAIIALRRNDGSHQSIANGVAAGHEACPRGGADGAGVKGFQLRAFSSQTINVRGLNVATVKADIPVTEIVSQKNDDVGLCGCYRGDGKAEKKEGKKNDGARKRHWILDSYKERVFVNAHKYNGVLAGAVLFLAER